MSTQTTALRDTAETAARERVRISATAGRSRATALARRVPIGLRYLGSEEAARSGLRYRPIAWTVIALAAVASWVPGRDSERDGSTALAQPPATFVTPTTTPGAPAVSTAATASPPALSPTSPSFAGPPTTAPPSSGTVTPTTTPAPPSPLTVREFGWASSLSGSGISTADVPEGTMPVAARLGQLDKVTFVRLAGSATALTLREDPDGAREAIGAAVVAACPITDATWQAGPDQSLDDAPSWNADACVTATEADGSWTFDLTSFADRTGVAGIALVPDPTAPPDFQVTFAPAS